MVQNRRVTFGLGALAVSLSLFAGNMAYAHEAKKGEGHVHSGHAHVGDRVHEGYFDDADVKARPFSDYDGDWQSLYPYLLDGTLDPVWEEKAKTGNQTAADYKTYYMAGYETDVSRITIKDGHVKFYRGDKVIAADYIDDGHEILTYKKGNRGVRFIFKKVSGDDKAPAFIQFSDHKIAPSPAEHYHIYWGDDRAEILSQLTNWPTYYPSSLSKKQIVEEMLAH